MATTKEKTSFKDWIKPILSRNFILILLIQTSQTFISNCNNTPLGNMGDALGFSAFLIGLCASLYNITNILAKPVAGEAVDKIETKKLLFFAFLTQSLMSLLYAFTGYAASGALFVVSRIIHGFVFGVLNTSLFAAVANAVDKKTMGTALGIFLAFPALVQAWAPKLTIYMFTTHGFTATYLLNAAMGIIPMVLSLFVKFDEQKRLASVGQNKRSFNIFKGISPKAIPLCSVSFFVLVAAFSNSTFRVLYFTNKGVDFGTAFVIASTLSAFTRFLGGLLTDRIGPKWVVTVSLVMFSIAMVLTGKTNTDAMCIVAVLVGSVGYAMYQPALQSQVFNAMPPEERGAVSATWFLCMDIPGLIFVPILGKIADKFGFEYLFYFAAVCVALGLVYYLLVVDRKIQKALADRAAEEALQAQQAE